MFIIALYIKNPPITRIVNTNIDCRRAASISRCVFLSCLFFLLYFPQIYIIFFEICKRILIFLLTLYLFIVDYFLYFLFSTYYNNLARRLCVGMRKAVR